MADNIEVLSYCLFSSQNMVDFIDFCINGTAADPTEPGVFEWLYSRRVTEAHFFTSGAQNPVGLFGAAILKPEPGLIVVPWTDRIKGFKRFVSADGTLGLVQRPFPQLTATLTHNQFLDDEYVKGAKPVADVFDALEAAARSGFDFTAEDFAAALRGDPKVDRKKILSEIELKFGKPLFDKPDLAKIKKALGI